MALRLCFFEARAHDLEHFAPRRHDAERRQRAAVNHLAPVNEHFELAVAAVDHVDIGAQISSKPRRHPDGVETGHSIRAIADDDPSQANLDHRPGCEVPPTTVIVTSLFVDNAPSLAVARRT